MDSELSSGSTTHSTPGPARTSVVDLKARIRRYNADVPADSPSFAAAVILLVGLEYGHNIDMLARRTGYDRSLVARCARRLTDNGVWQQGRTIAEWSQADEASGTFWNDVAVAEGRMCRRINPEGRFEWAPAGYWNKSFLFADPAAPDQLTTTYLDATAPPAEPVPAPPVETVDPPALPPAGTHDPRVLPEKPAGPRPSPLTLFEDVVWIG